MLNVQMMLFGSSLHDTQINMNEQNSRRTSQTDWERLARMTDDEIDYSDIPALDDSFFENATLRSQRKQRISLQVDADIIAWFAEQNQNYKQQMSLILKQYVEQQRQLIV